MKNKKFYDARNAEFDNFEVTKQYAFCLELSSFQAHVKLLRSSDIS